MGLIRQTIVWFFKLHVYKLQATNPRKIFLVFFHIKNKYKNNEKTFFYEACVHV